MESKLLGENAMKALRKETKENLKHMQKAFIEIAKENQMQEEMENKETVMCERCGGDFAAWWIEDCDQMWCRDCRDALTEGLIQLWNVKNAEKQSEENNKLDPEFTKELIMSEINERGSVCIEADSLENTFEEDKFYDWLDEMELAMYCSYTICKKGKEEGQEE